MKKLIIILIILIYLISCKNPINYIKTVVRIKSEGITVYPLEIRINNDSIGTLYTSQCSIDKEVDCGLIKVDVVYVGNVLKSKSFMPVDGRINPVLIKGINRGIEICTTKN